MSSYKELVVEIKAAQPEEKLKSDPFMIQKLYRPMAYYLAALNQKTLKLKPNTISLLAGVLAVFTIFVAFAWPNVVLVSILLLLVSTLDCVDGSLARYLKTAGPKGELADAIGGFAVLWSVPFVAWLIMFPVDERLSQQSLLLGLASAVVVAFHYLGRTIYQKRVQIDTNLEIKGIDKGEELSKGTTVGKINSELSFCGFMFPIMIVFWLLGAPVVSWAYVVLYLFLTGCAGGLSGIKRALR